LHTIAQNRNKKQEKKEKSIYMYICYIVDKAEKECIIERKEVIEGKINFSIAYLSKYVMNLKYCLIMGIMKV